ncbi:bifunctional rhamnulose-1-phosphate aldolase/short-chain dehydrogenase [soil metagenome]
MTSGDLPGVRDLIERSNRIGSDPRNTNYGGGNTSTKGIVSDPATGAASEVVWVKGSGGDLGTLTPAGLTALHVARVQQLKAVYRGEDHEDEMFELLDRCLFDPHGAPPSIDTFMHALVPRQHVDHLHPDAVIALAAAADGEALTKRCYGDDVAWLPWRRPGMELGLRIERMIAESPGLLGVVMGGHGLSAWGETSADCERNSLELIRRAAEFIERESRSDPLGPVRPGYEGLPEQQRLERAAALAPYIRGMAATDSSMIGHWTDDELVLDFISRESAPRVVPLGTSCPDHFIRTKVRPLLLDLPATASLEDQVTRLAALHLEYRDEYRAYYERYADSSTPPMRGADPAIFLVPGVGMFSFGSDAHTARVAGEFYINAINVIRGSEGLSTYAPVPEHEKFKVEYWALEEAKLQRRPKPKALAGKVALVTGAGSGIGKAIARRLVEEGAVVIVSDIDGQAASRVAHEIGSADSARAVTVDVTDEDAARRAVDDAVRAFGGIDILVNNAGLSIAKPLLETTEADWDIQHDVMAKGSFFFSKYAARKMIDQGTGGDIIYIVSKNAVFAGPNNVAYGSAKASQAHQVRLLAAELGGYGIRVNGINPDAVVRDSGIFASGWGAERAKTYGVPESELGQYYATRTVLKKEVLPEHVAAAAAVLVSGALSQTTGMLVPVDSGLPVAFLR